MEIPTMRIRFKEAEGGHEGLINAVDFDPARHIPVLAEPEPELTTIHGHNLATGITSVEVAPEPAAPSKPSKKGGRK